jgi:hypothetical protein
MDKMTQPGRPEMTAASLLLTTTGRKSGEIHLPAVLWEGRRRLFRGRLERRGAATSRPVPQPPFVQAGTAKIKPRPRTAHRRGARAAVGKGAGVLAALRRLQTRFFVSARRAANEIRIGADGLTAKMATRSAVLRRAFSWAGARQLISALSRSSPPRPLPFWKISDLADHGLGTASDDHRSSSAPDATLIDAAARHRYQTIRFDPLRISIWVGAGRVSVAATCFSRLFSCPSPSTQRHSRDHVPRSSQAPAVCQP